MGKLLTKQWINACGQCKKRHSWMSCENIRSERHEHNSNFVHNQRRGFVFSSYSRSRSYFTTDSQSVSQSVLVSSPLCGRLTRYCFIFKSLGLQFVVLSLWGALSDERPGLSFVSHSLVICLCVHLLFTFLYFTHLPYTYIHYTMHIIYTGPLLVPAR
jgi:hypothetical protein